MKNEYNYIDSIRAEMKIRVVLIKKTCNKLRLCISYIV